MTNCDPDDDLDEAAEKCAREIMEMKAKKNREKQKSFARDYEAFKRENIERTIRRYGKTGKYM